MSNVMDTETMKVN